MAEKKPFLLRLPPETMEAVQRLARDELRSVNAQIEVLIREALKHRKIGIRSASEPETPED